MKIVKPVRDLYDTCKPKYDRLEAEVHSLLKPKVERNGWFFISRVKTLESYALKLETGRVPDPAQMEDFLGCTIVVPTLVEIEQASALVVEMFNFEQKRPPIQSETHKSPSDFQFDDLRLYVTKKPSASGANQDLDGSKFEVQIKTILQHAWSVATHDLIYKSGTVSWPRERIAFQVKAMLEHAEIAIAEANRLADAPGVARTDNRKRDVLSIIEALKELWPEENLPSDVKRLAENIHSALIACNCKPDAFQALIETEKARVKVVPMDISPYAFTIQALAQSTTIDLKGAMSRKRFRNKILVHPGMDLPEWMLQDNSKLIRM